MLTEDQIEAMARANWPGIEWDDESLAESAHLREAFRAGVRAVIAAHEAKAAPAVPQGINLGAAWIGYARLDGNEYKLASLRRNPVMEDGQLHPIYTFSDAQIDAIHTAFTTSAQSQPAVPQVVLQVIDAKIASVREANIGRGGLINSAISFAIGLLEDVREAIAAHEAKAAPAVPLSAQELDLCRQWFDAVRDLNPAHLERADYVLGMRLYQVQGMRVPKSVVAPSQPVNRPQNCGTSFCSCIECVCETEPVTLTDAWLLEQFKHHPNWELSTSNDPECDPSTFWRVHEVQGGRYYREWVLIGEGESPRAAIVAALREKEQAK